MSIWSGVAHVPQFRRKERVIIDGIAAIARLRSRGWLVAIMGLDRVAYLMALEVSKGVNHSIVQTSPLEIETIGLRRIGECLKCARGRVHRIGVAELGVVDGQRRQMAPCTPDLAEQGFPFSCKLIISILIIVLHSNWH